MVRILIFVIISNAAWGQSEMKTSLSGKVFEIYRKEADPYLKKFAEGRFINDSSSNYVATIRATYIVYLADIHKIESTISDELNKNPKSAEDKNYISKLVEFHYQNEFVGLPKEFWASARKRISELDEN